MVDEKKESKAKPVKVDSAKDVPAKDVSGKDDPKVKELTDDLKRVQAEFENYKKRCEKENNSFKEYAKADLIRKLIAVLDSFGMALNNTKNHDEFVKGVELIYSQLYSVLREEGLEQIETKDRMFDPYYHEVLLTEPSEKEDDFILDEFQKGYTLKGKVIRHAKVKVAKKKE